MRKLLLVAFCIVSSLTLCGAQGFGYDSKIELGNGLFVVRSSDSHGIIDAKGNVVVSIEYQELLFRNGKALLTKGNVLYGVVDSLGRVKSIPPIFNVHPKYRYVYDGVIVVGHTKWGFITENGEPIQCRTKSKVKGLVSMGRNYPTMFDDVYPFVDGYATVYSKKNGWKHIDKEGNYRFMFGNKKIKALFRSSIHNGECIIITDDGVKQYQENAMSQAVVKRILSSRVGALSFYRDSVGLNLQCQDGSLSLDTLMRSKKFTTGSDSIVFIEDPKPVVIEDTPVVVPQDTLSLKDDLKVELVYKNVSANEKGMAYTEVKFINTSSDKFEELHVTMECAGVVKEWTKSLGADSQMKIPFSIPARFSSPTMTRDIKVTIGHKKETVEYEYSVTIKRYTPVRSR